MAPSTRNTPRDTPVPHFDTEMEENPSQLTLLPTQPTVREITHPTRAVKPANHPEPTLQQIVNPQSDLAAYIEAIPSTIHVENVEFSIHHTTTFNHDTHLAEIQTQFGVADAKFNQLIQMVST